MNDIQKYIEEFQQLELLKQKKVYERTFTSSIEFGRSHKSRSELKQLDKYLANHYITRYNYTGMVGRRLCFAFDTEEEKLTFEASFAKLLKEKNIKFLQNT